MEKDSILPAGLYYRSHRDYILHLAVYIATNYKNADGKQTDLDRASEEDKRLAHEVLEKAGIAKPKV